MRVVLDRYERTPYATYGKIVLPTATIVTLEHPWTDKDGNGLGDTGCSCIPAGIEFELFFRPNAETRHDYDVWELKGVPGRKHIQVHIGNVIDHTDGCILVGLQREKIEYPPKSKKFYDGISGSRTAYVDHWMKALNRKEKHTLIAIEPISWSKTSCKP